MNLQRNSINQSLLIFQRRRFNVNATDEVSAADLKDMQAFSKDNNGMKYLLTGIDIFYNLFGIFLKTENWTGSCKHIFEDLKRTKTL